MAKPPVKLSSVVNASRYVPATSSSTLIVGVRVRPLLGSEHTKGNRKDIIRVLDGRVVVVLDPDEQKDYLDQVQNRTKEKRYTFDIAFETMSNNEDVYNGTVRDLVSGVLYGVNTTVFAYGATGSGKTYTMVGTPTDPGLMVLSLQRIFQDRDKFFKDEEFEVTCTYLEVYNEVIYDLLVKNSSPLELREDPDLGVQVAGLRHINVGSAGDILDLLEEGNRRRKTEATDANSQSSRSHAVLEICIKRKPRNHYRVQQLRAKLALVDLAGSERAAETNNAGQKLRDGANINRSLLALANCINALGKMAGGGKGGAAYVPYRNSKLTRLLKDGLSGNSRTCMIATVSAASDQYHHSINTLKYADRAKEIKTHVVQNVGTVESHIADYQRIIDNLQLEVQDLRSQLSDRVMAPTPAPGITPAPRGAEDELLTHIDGLVQDMHENIEERINLQKALFEIEDANLFNRYELKQLDEFIEAGQGSAKDLAEARDRRTDIAAAIRDNDKELAKFKAEITSNEAAKRDIQSRIDRLVNSNQNVAFLNLMSTFRLQAVRVQELRFQMAVRDQIISEQREVISNLWRIIDKSGLGRARVLEIAKQEGIIMDGFLMPLTEEPSRPETALLGLAQNGKPQAVAGLIAAQDAHAATPNASLAGNRAKMRYKFWAQYAGDHALGVGTGAGDDDEWEEDTPGGANGIVAGSPGARGTGKARRGGKGGAGILPSAAKRRGAGIRVDHVTHLHPQPGRRRRSMLPDRVTGDGRSNDGGTGGGAGSNGAATTGALARTGGRDDGNGPATAPANLASADPLGGTTTPQPSSGSTSALYKGSSGNYGPVSAAVVSAITGTSGRPGGHNATVPTIRSGRRAGQPLAGRHQRSSSDDLKDGAAAFDLPRPAYADMRGPSDDGGGAGGGGGSSGAASGIASSSAAALAARRRSALDAISAAATAALGNAGPLDRNGPGGGAPRPPPAPPAQAPLNERLAKLKGRLGAGAAGKAKAEGDAGGDHGDGDSGGAGGLAVAGVGLGGGGGGSSGDRGSHAQPSQPAAAQPPVSRPGSRNAGMAAGVVGVGFSRPSIPGDSLDQALQNQRRLSSAGSQSAAG